MKIKVRYFDDNIVELVTYKRIGKGYLFYIQSSAKRPQISHYGGGDEKWSCLGITDSDGNNMCEISFLGEWDIIADHEKWSVSAVLMPYGTQFKNTTRIKPRCYKITLPTMAKDNK